MAKDRDLKLRLKAVDRMSTAIDRVKKRFPKLTRSIKRASRASQIFNAQTKRMRAALTKIGGGMQRFGKSMTTFVTLPLVAGAAIGVKLFGKFQQGLRGIEKTTGLARDVVAKLGEKFDKLSTQIPVSTEEMLELAKAAGQLGVSGVDDLEKFTVTMAKLSRASDVAGEEGAKAVARILTVTDEGVGKVDRFAAALVGLGNKAAASETEILGIATRIALATGDFNVGSKAILGMAAAMKSMGIKAESGGTVIGKSFRRISKIIAKGGTDFRALQRITGMSGAVLKKTFETDASKVFRSFLEGLAKFRAKGEKTTLMLEAFGLIGERVNAVIPVMVKKIGLVGKELERSAKLWQENTALQREFEIQIDSFNSSMIILSNTFKSLLRLIGAELAPVVLFLGKIFKSVFNFLRDNPTIRTLVIVFGALLAVLGPILVAVGAFLVILPALTAGMAALGVASFPITGTMLLIGAAIAALIVLIVVIIKKWDVLKKFFSENPFGKVLTFIFTFLSPLFLIIRAFTKIIDLVKSLSKLGVKETFRNLLPESLGNFLLGAKLGPDKGATESNRGVAQPDSAAINGQIGVTFRNAPEGTRVKGNLGGPLGLNLGFAGALQ